MTDAARGSRPRNQPGLASADASDSSDRDDDSRTSQKRPALRFYEPLPLGSDAFMAPLAPPREPETVNRGRLAAYCIVGGALGLAFGGAALAFFSNTTMERPLNVKVMDLPPAVAEVREEEAEPPEPAKAAPVVAEAKAAPAPVAADTAAVATPEAPAPAAQQHAAAEAPAETPRPASTERRRSSRREERSIDKPSRAQVLAAMGRVQPAVKACFAGNRGTVVVDIRVEGRTGRVASAQASGQTGAVGSCVARAVRKAKFPRFTDDSLSIRYPMAF
jgi:hypothetical protein